VRTTKPMRRKVPLRRLREHPSIHWPPGIEPNPTWNGPVPEVPDPSRIVLTGVEIASESKGHRPHLTLMGEYDGNPYRTTLASDDVTLLGNLCDSLKECIGEKIVDIGEHRVDSALNLV